MTVRAGGHTASADPALPLTQAHALAVEPYVHPDWAAIEQARVFRQSWQLVGSAAEIAGPGDHLAREIAGVPVLVVRQPDGSVQAFHNVCRHRAGPLASCDGKGARALRCRYHGWLYGLDGRLKVAAEMDEAEDFAAAELALEPVRVGVWQGFVFVCLGTETPPLEEILDGIEARMTPTQLAPMVHRRHWRDEIACNWKVYIDNYLEGYHLPFVHPDLARVVSYAAYNSTLAPWYSLQYAPVSGAGDAYGAGEALYYFVYPNFMLNIMPGRLQVNVVTPLGPDRCTVDFDFYYLDQDDVQARVEADLAFTAQIQREDVDICLKVQKALASGVYRPGRLSPRREAGVWHFQNLLRRAYGWA